MNFKKEYCIVGLGEVLWDLLPGGKKLGGAPANFAYHAKSLGAESFIVSGVGDDLLGKEILSSLKLKSLNTEYIQTLNQYPTGTVEVILDRNGTPEYKINEEVAWDHIIDAPALYELSEKSDCVCFGSLAQRNRVSRKTILTFLKNTEKRTLRIFDVNLRQNYFNKEIIEQSLELSNCLKLNDSELNVIKEMFNLEGDDTAVLRDLMTNYNLLFLAFTKGEKGSYLLDKEEISFMEPEKVNIVDTVGAGDSFTAGLAIGYLNSLSLKEIHNLANRLASYVCSREGATPELPDDFIDRINL